MSRRPTTSESEPVGEEGFDGLLSSIGFGKWHIIILMVPILTMAVYPVHLLGASFLNAPLPFRCSLGDPDICQGNDEGCWNQSAPLLQGNNISYYDSRCLLDPITNASTLESINSLDLPEYQRRTSLSSCPVIEYDTSMFTSTIVSEFNLVCEQSYMRPWFVTLGTIGHMIGSVLGGFIGDRFGRIRAVQVGTILNILTVVAMYLSPYYSLMLVTRVIVGCSTSAALVPAWSIGLECTPSKYRTLAGMFLGLPFSVFLMAYAGMAYYIRGWHNLLLAGSSPALLLLVTVFIASESPRWLIQKGRLEEAREVLLLSSKLNGANMEPTINAYVDKMAVKLKAEWRPSTSEENTTCKMSMVGSLKTVASYFRSPAMRTIIICIGCIWILHHLLYIGVALNANNFSSDDPFLYVALTGVMDMSAILIITPLTSCFGRRVLIMIGFLVSGTLFFLEMIVPDGLEWVRWVLVMSGFFLVAGSMQVNFLYAPEVFPTEIRARGFAFVQVLGSIGSSIAPFITDVLSLYSWWGPPVAFGCSGIVGGLLLPFLPETKNKPLPDTVQEVEERSKKGLKRDRFAGVENKGYAEDASCHL